MIYNIDSAKQRAHGWVWIVLPIVGCFIAYSSDAEASINFYRVGKRIAYVQTSDSQPAAPVAMDGGVDLFATNSTDLTLARAFSTSPTLLSPASPFILSEFAPGSWATGQFYDSLESMDVALPPGDIFGFLIEGGDLGSRLALLPLPATNLFASDIPYFTNNAYSELNGLSVNSPIQISWNGFTPPAEANDSPIFFTIYRVSDGQPVISTVVNHLTTTFEIPANTFASATQYRADLDYSSRLNSVDSGFIDADAAAAFDLLTSLYFTTGNGGGAATGLLEPATVPLVFAGMFAIVIGVRRRRRHLSYGFFLILLVFVGRSSPAEAAIDFYRVGKAIVYTQTSNAQPTVPTSFYGGPDIFTATPSDLTSARVFSTTTSPPSPVPEFILNQFAPGSWGYSQGYASLTEMDMNLPPGDMFGYLVEGGSLGSQLALLPLPSTNLFASDVPYVTGNTFSELNALNTGAPYTVNWNAFNPAPESNNSPIFFTIYRVSDGQSIISTVVSHSETSYVIPAGALTPSTQYLATLIFSSRVDTIDAGFLSADSSVLFDVQVQLQFTTADSLAGDFNDDGHVDAADYVVWRKSDGTQPGYNAWRANFGASLGGEGNLTEESTLQFTVPEPATTLLLTIGAILATSRLIAHRIP
jgi:hypothetical protein